MKQRIAVGVALITLSLPFVRAQQPTPGTVKPASHDEAAGVPTPLRGLHNSARSGAEWLVRVHNDVNGRFLPGWFPAVAAPADESNFLDQAVATAALARAARYYNDERYLMEARQAVLSLLTETRVDSGDATCRTTTLPAIVVNPLAAAGALLVAIHELQNPAEDLLKQGEELANFVRKQQQADGTFAGTDNNRACAAWAVRGLMASMRNRSAPWKLEVVAKALPACRKNWQSSPSLALAASLTPGFAEAFARTKDRSYADFVFEMCDWACDMQYGADTNKPKWVGGFKAGEHGKPVLRAPDVSSAANVEALALGCLVTRHAQDSARYRRYREAAELGSQFLAGLQYTDASTGHFTPGYRMALIGGYHESLHDGNLWLGHNADAVMALVLRLTCVGDR